MPSLSDENVIAAREKVTARARCRHDKFFLADVLGYDFQPETHAELFANFIQYRDGTPWSDQSEVKDRLILWPRGHFKTTAVVVEIIQAILNFPNIRILIMQGSILVTATLLRQVVSHFTGQALGSRLMELFPEFCGDKQALHGTKMHFTTPARTDGKLAQATVTVASPKSVKTGQHYDLGFFDDLVNDQNWRKSNLIRTVREDFTLAQALIDPGGYRVVSGTRYTFGDLYEEITRWNTKSGKWIVDVKDCWTDASAKLPDAQKVPRFPQFTKKNGEQGGFTREYLLQMQEDDPENFANQYLNKPIHSSAQFYTPELLNGALIASKDTPPLSTPILMIDLACSENATADDSVIEMGRIDGLGVGYLCDMRGGQWTPHDLALNILDMALRHRPLKIFIEGSASAKYFVDFLRLIAMQKGIFLPLDLVKVDTQADAKNMRVVALAGVIKRGRFKFLAGLPKFDKLTEQACEFPKGRSGHDDYIDTAALLFGQLCKEMLSLPVRKPVGTGMFAVIAQAEADELQNMMTAAPPDDVTNETGLD